MLLRLSCVMGRYMKKHHVGVVCAYLKGTFVKFYYFYVLCGYMVIHAADIGVELSPSMLSRFKTVAVAQTYFEGKVKVTLSVDDILQKNVLKELKKGLHLSLESDISPEVPMFWLHHIIAHPKLADRERVSLKSVLKERYELYQRQYHKQELCHKQALYHKQELFTWLLAEEHIPIIVKHSEHYEDLFENAMCCEMASMYFLSRKTRRLKVPPLVPMYWLYRIQKLSHTDDQVWLGPTDLDALYTIIYTYAQKVLKDPEKQKLYPDFFTSLPKE